MGLQSFDEGFFSFLFSHLLLIGVFASFHPSISVFNISLFLSLFLFRVLGYFASHLQQSNVPPMCFLPRVSPSPSHTHSRPMLARLQTLSSNLSNHLCARIPLNLVVHNCIRSIQSIQSHPIPSTHLYDMILVYVSSPLYLVPFHPFSIGYYIWYLGCICITCFPVFHNLYRLM